MYANFTASRPRWVHLHPPFPPPPPPKPTTGLVRITEHGTIQVEISDTRHQLLIPMIQIVIKQYWYSDIDTDTDTTDTDTNTWLSPCNFNMILIKVMWHIWQRHACMVDGHELRLLFTWWTRCILTNMHSNCMDVHVYSSLYYVKVVQQMIPMCVGERWVGVSVMEGCRVDHQWWCKSKGPPWRGGKYAQYHMWLDHSKLKHSCRELTNSYQCNNKWSLPPPMFSFLVEWLRCWCFYYHRLKLANITPM